MSRSRILVIGSGGGTTPPDNGAVMLLDSGGFASTTINPSSGTGNFDQYLRGGDFDTPLWASETYYSWYCLGITGNGNPEAVSNYILNSFKTVKGRDNIDSRALSLAILKDAPGTGVEQVRVTEYQDAGLSGVGGRVEPVFYQRMWVKFDPNMLIRAQRVGSTDFYFILWEAKAEPDYRFRIELNYDGTKLFWHSQTDILSNATAIYNGTNTSVPVTLAGPTSQSGWHKIEVWMDRANGNFRTAVNGSTILNVAGGSLMGSSGNILNFPMFMQCYSGASMGAGFSSDAPMEMMVDDFQLWDRPPADAW